MEQGRRKRYRYRLDGRKWEISHYQMRVLIFSKIREEDLDNVGVNPQRTKQILGGLVKQGLMRQSASGKVYYRTRLGQRVAKLVIEKRGQ